MAADKKFGLLVELKSDIKKFQTGMGKAQSGIKKFTANLGTMAKGMIAAFSIKLIVGFIKQVSRFSDVQAKAEATLLIALKGRKDVQQRLIQQASQLQKKTLFGDEATIEAQAMLASMGLEEEAIKRLTPLVQDFATIKKMKLAAAADLVAKSVGSSTNALSRYGIEITGAVGSSKRLDTAVTGLTAKFSGQAEAAAKVGMGAFTQLSNIIGDMKERIGALIIKGLNPLINAGIRLLGSLNKQSKALEQENIKLNTLVRTATSATISEQARLTVIKQIQTEYPDFLENIDAEKVSNEQLKEALEETNLQMKERIRLMILQEALAADEAKLLKQVAKEIRLEQQLEAVKSSIAREEAMRSGGRFMETEASMRYYNGLLKQQKFLEGQLRRTGDRQDRWNDSLARTNALIVEQLTKMGALGIDTGGGDGGDKKTFTKAPGLDKIASIGTPTGIDFSGAYEAQESREAKHWEKMLRIYQAYQVEKVRLAGMEQAAEEATRDKRLAIAQEITQAMSAGINGVSNIFEAAKQRELSAVGDNAAKREAIEKKYAKKQKVLAIGQAVIGVALAVINALQTKPFIPMGLIAAISAGVMGGIQIAAIATTPLAKGGLAYGSVLANIGEYPGARSNPEVIAPLNKLQGLLGIGGVVEFEIRGDRLVGVLQNYDSRRKLMA